MFSIFKKKQSGGVDLSGIATDMHSHLLPGIDDGSPDDATSLLLMKGLQQLGYQQFIATPHILWDVHKNDANSIGKAHAQLQAALERERLQVPIRAAAEYYLDEHFDGLLQKNVPLLPIKGDMVLVEFSFVTMPMNVKEKLFELQIKGYKPILAHPERYTYLLTQKHVFDELKQAGCYFQLNLLSLTGYYGKPVQDLAAYLIKKKYINFLGTDLHHERHLQALQSSSSLMNGVKQLLDSGNILNHTL
jgi:tyrosine-protein phosphatase YwqE